MSDGGVIRAQYILDASQVPQAAAQIRAQINGIGQQVSQAGVAGTQMGQSIGGGFLSVLGPAALAHTEIRAIKELLDLAAEGENIGRVSRSFESLAKQAGTTGDEVLTALQKASGGEISDLNLKLAVNKGQLLGVADSAKEFSDIMEIARDRAAKMGISTTKAFDDINTGIGRESPRILDNLGIIISLSDAHQKYADSVGKSVDQLTKAERIEAVRNAVIAQGKGTLDAATTAANNQANSITRLNTALENARDRGAQGLANTYGRLATSLFQGVDVINNVIQGTQDLFTVTDAERAAAKAYHDEIARGAPIIAAEAAYEKTLADEKARTTQQFIVATDEERRARGEAQIAIGQQQIALAQTGGAYGAYAQAANQAGIASAQAAAQIQFSTQSMQIAARASVEDSAAKERQTLITQKLQAETNAAANAFIALHPNITTAGVASLVMAGDLDKATAEMVLLRLEAGRTGAALALLAQQQAGIASIAAIANQGVASIQKNLTGDVGSRVGGGASGLLRDQQTLADLQLQNRLINAKTAADRIRILQAQLARTVNAEERQRLQNQIDQERKAGGGRVSAAQSTALQLQNVEENSGARLLQIQRENQERLADAQRDYNLSRSRREEDFQQRYIGLLARGQKAEAARAKAEFEKQQRRDAEDQAIRLHDIRRNNAEALGDTAATAERRSGQIQARAALRGVTATSGGVPSGVDTSGGGSVASSGARVIQVTLPNTLVTPDGQVIANITYPFIAQRLDDDLSIELRGAALPGSSQTAVSGARP